MPASSILRSQRLVKTPVPPQEDVSGKLHGDGAGPGHNRLVLHILYECAGHTPDVDAGIVIEGGILGGNRGVDQVLRHAGDADPRAPSFRIDLGNQLAMSIIDIGGLKEPRLGARLILLQIRFHGRQQMIRRARADLLRRYTGAYSKTACQNDPDGRAETQGSREITKNLCVFAPLRPCVKAVQHNQSARSAAAGSRHRQQPLPPDLLR